MTNHANGVCDRTSAWNGSSWFGYRGRKYHGSQQRGIAEIFLETTYGAHAKRSFALRFRSAATDLGDALAAREDGIRLGIASFLGDHVAAEREVLRRRAAYIFPHAHTVCAIRVSSIRRAALEGTQPHFNNPR